MTLFQITGSSVAVPSSSLAWQTSLEDVGIFCFYQNKVISLYNSFDIHLRSAEKVLVS